MLEGPQTFVVTRLEGKLVGIRADMLPTMKQVDALRLRLFAVLDAAPAHVVVCADCRTLHVVNEEVIAALTSDFVREDAKVQRSALLMPRRAEVLRFQMERALRDSNNQDRRICTDAAEAKAWLCSSLALAERNALDSFLGGYPNSRSGG